MKIEDIILSRVRVQIIQNPNPNPNLNKMSECPICFETMSKNLIKTECGHEFHSSCFLTNVAHNGFNCPCCRNKLAEIPDDSEDEEEDTNTIDEVNEEVEQYEDMVLPTSEYILKTLQEKNVTMMDLLKIVLHQELVPYFDQNDEKESEIYLKVDNIIYEVVDNYEEIREQDEEKENMKLEDKRLENKSKDYKLLNDIETILDMRVY